MSADPPKPLISFTYLRIHHLGIGNCAVSIPHSERDRHEFHPRIALFRNLGVNLHSDRLFDFRGRPQYLVDSDVKPIAELV